MIKEIKYYTFKDPITGVLTKDIGFVHEESRVEFDGHVDKGEVVVKRNNTVRRQVTVKPKNSTEVSKKEFDALDTTGESETIRESRQKNILKIERLRLKEAGKISVLDKDVIVEEIDSVVNADIPSFVTAAVAAKKVNVVK